MLIFILSLDLNPHLEGANLARVCGLVLPLFPVLGEAFLPVLGVLGERGVGELLVLRGGEVVDGGKDLVHVPLPV